MVLMLFDKHRGQKETTPTPRLRQAEEQGDRGQHVGPVIHSTDDQKGRTGPRAEKKINVRFRVDGPQHPTLGFNPGPQA
jgi:hypothetical protein